MSSKEFEEIKQMLHQYMERVGTLEAQMKEQQELTKMLKWQHQIYEIQTSMMQMQQENRIYELELQLQLNQLQFEQQRQATLASRPAPVPAPALPPALPSALPSAPQAATQVTLTRGQGRGRRGRRSRHERHFRIDGSDFWAESLRYTSSDGVTIEF
ncbi:hypothetical protein J3F84DRAFT_344981 [Trichoderma pleuroticola]